MLIKLLIFQWCNKKSQIFQPADFLAQKYCNFSQLFPILKKWIYFSFLNVFCSLPIFTDVSEKMFSVPLPIFSTLVETALLSYPHRQENVKVSKIESFEMHAQLDCRCLSVSLLWAGSQQDWKLMYAMQLMFAWKVGPFFPMFLVLHFIYVVQ